MNDEHCADSFTSHVEKSHSHSLFSIVTPSHLSQIVTTTSPATPPSHSPIAKISWRSSSTNISLTQQFLPLFLSFLSPLLLRTLGALLQSQSRTVVRSGWRRHQLRHFRVRKYVPQTLLLTPMLSLGPARQCDDGSPLGFFRKTSAYAAAGPRPAKAIIGCSFGYSDTLCLPVLTSEWRSPRPRKIRISDDLINLDSRSSKI